ncbi:peptidoglycan-binding protein [Gottfriedia sp. NPDC057948]|uniref:peptidoglycan-binding domain-containing protein n=1 Tax=Gottfriedia sp. NPDC057948 TaxID=3346287 RepID=UPI0036DF5463
MMLRWSFYHLCRIEIFNSFSETHCLAVDNIFGEKTLAAVKSFQEKEGLVVDGVVGEKTWIKIFK